MKYIGIRKEFKCITDADKQWLRLKLRWYSLLHSNGGKCIKCGESDFSCLEFHHRDPEAKDDQISNLIMGNGGWDKAKSEASKCDVLCRNCHYEIHNSPNISRRKYIFLGIANKDRCELCSYTKKQCLDFHHMYGKDFTIGKAQSNNDTIELKKELIKCKVVCKNCHKKLHVNRERMDKWGDLLIELSKEYDNFSMGDHIAYVVENNKGIIKQLYWVGDKIPNIMKYLGIGHSGSIRKHFNECIEGLGLVRKPKAVREKKINPFDSISDEKIISTWNDTSNKFIKDVAKALGVSMNAIGSKISKLRKKYDNILDRKEFVKQFEQYRPTKREGMNDIEIQLVELRKQGKSSNEVAQIVGKTPNSVRLRYSKLIKRGFIDPIPKEWSNQWNK